LVQVIVELRRALGDDSRRPRYIKTIPKAGYRFISAVEAVYTDAAPPLTFEEITSVEFEYREEIRDDAISPARAVAAVIAPPAPRRWFHRHLARAIIAVVAIALVAGLWIVLQKRLTRQAGTVAEMPLPQVPGRRTVAVIFFDNQSESRDLDWLREGLADMLITNLSR